MSTIRTWNGHRLGRRHATAALLPAAALLLAAGCGGGSTSSTASSAASGGLVRAVPNQSLGGSVLVNQRGFTLYALSAERAGHFVCAGMATLPGSSTPCVAVWKPLSVRGGQALASSVGNLGTIQRPDGGLQVTYKGMPLYTFADDQRPGQVSGNGFHDVGTWKAVTLGGAAAGGTPTTNGGGYSPGY